MRPRNLLIKLLITGYDVTLQSDHQNILSQCIYFIVNKPPMHHRIGDKQLPEFRFYSLLNYF